VWAVDVNPRAVELTAANAGALGIGDRVRAVAPDGVPGTLRFAQIWSNPPVRVGKAELDALLARWLPRLTVDGTAWLVAARHLGGDSLQRRLIDSGWEVVRQASQKGYRLLRVTRRSRADAVG
jgi:16S rRNA G1207 methylase RsmC